MAAKVIKDTAIATGVGKLIDEAVDFVKKHKDTIVNGTKKFLQDFGEGV